MSSATTRPALYATATVLSGSQRRCCGEGPCGGGASAQRSGTQRARCPAAAASTSRLSSSASASICFSISLLARFVARSSCSSIFDSPSTITAALPSSSPSPRSLRSPREMPRVRCPVRPPAPAPTIALQAFAGGRAPPRGRSTLAERAAEHRWTLSAAERRREGVRLVLDRVIHAPAGGRAGVRPTGPEGRSPPVARGSGGVAGRRPPPRI
jgi:hypothetical protein